MIDLSRIKLGAIPSPPDPRNIMVREFLRPKLLPPLPPIFDTDSVLGVIPDSADGNDQYGCCVKSAQAKQIRRFEKYECGEVPNITRDIIIAEYFQETGGVDSGLVVSESLKRWRKEGWTIDGKNYRIYAFADVNWLNHLEVKYSAYLFNGVQVTLALPISATQQEVWDVVEGDNAVPGSWGYHQVYVKQYHYNEIGPVLTWGKPQHLTWSWWDKYVIQAVAVIDDKNDWLPNSPVDRDKLAQLLKEVTNNEFPPPEPEPLPEPDPVPPPRPEPSPIPPDNTGCNPLSNIMKIFKRR